MRIRSYSVHVPPGVAEPERFAFVKDGFSWPAFFVPILWILWHRLWLALLAFVIFVLVVAWTGRLLSEDAATIIALLGVVLFALEANNIRRLSLESRGWREAGMSSGRNIEEAELRFFDKWANTSAAAPPTAAKSEVATYPHPMTLRRERAAEEPVIGLFPEPEH